QLVSSSSGRHCDQSDSRAPLHLAVQAGVLRSNAEPQQPVVARHADQRLLCDWRISGNSEL
ncbi:hypothetical protein AMECASPLE_039612, partial [Ameca splendens]